MIKKSITITFVAIDPRAGDSLVLELDSEKNDEETEFAYGTKAYFRAYTYPTSMSLEMTPTDGTITSEGSGSSDEEDFVSFVDTNEASLSKPCNTLTSTSWLGTSLGSVSILGDKITVSTKGTGVLKVVFKGSFRRYGLTLNERDEDSYPVIVFVEGTVS